MGRRKGSLNKKSDRVILDEKSEVVMASETMVDEIVNVDQDYHAESKSDEMVLDSIQTEIDLARAELERTKLEIEEKKKELANPRREITKEDNDIAEKQATITNKNKSKSEIIERQRAHDKQKVTGRFINRHRPGQPVKLPYHKYVDDPVVWHTLKDGETYTIDRGFADQLNGGDERLPCYYTPRFTQKEGPQNLSDTAGENSMINHIDTSNSKYQFVPVGFS